MCELLLLYAVATFCIELAEVCPLVVREGVCLYGQGSFLTIEDALDEDVIAGLLRTVEDELHITSLTGLPVLIDVLYLVWILRVCVSIIDAHQHLQGTQAVVVTKAQVGNTVAATIDYGISLLDDVLQDGYHDIALREQP